jgi:DNA polymerase-3 subunit epsilon
VRFSRQAELTAEAIALVLLPTATVIGVGVVLHRLGALDAGVIALVVAAGAVAMVTIPVAVVAYRRGRARLRGVQALQFETELMATVNPDHRLREGPGDELESLAGEINRMADRLRDARRGLENEVARATRELEVERGKLSAVLEALGEGVVLAMSDGMMILANPAAHELLSAPPGGLLGRSLFDFVDREKIAHFLERLGAAAAGAERFSLHPAGRAIVEAVMTPFSGGPGSTVGFVLVLKDVTGPARLDVERLRRQVEMLRHLRSPVASIRSLSENLLDDSAAVTATGRRLLEAVHAEALRLSGMITEAARASSTGLVGAPRHFEALTVSGLATMTLRRLGADASANVLVDAEGGAGIPLQVEASALSGALAHLLRVVLGGHRSPEPVWFRPRRHGGVLQIDLGAEGGGTVSELEASLDVAFGPGVDGPLTVRTVVQHHAGEVWAYAAEGRLGFRLTLPVEECPGAPAEAAAPPRVSLVGAGTASGYGPQGVPTERPDFYDFSLFEEMARHLLPADRECPLDELTCTVIDTETTGLSPDEGDRIVSLAAVRIRGAVIRRGETFDALVNPGRPIPLSSVAFHGITDAMVAEAPPIDVVLAAFLRFAGHSVLVGHQIWFDLRFLERVTRRLGVASLARRHAVLDTLTLSEVVHGPLQHHGLDAMATRFGVVVHGRHSALGDTLATAEIFVRLIALLRKRGISTLGGALEASRQARRFPSPRGART